MREVLKTLTVAGAIFFGLACGLNAQNGQQAEEEPLITEIKRADSRSRRNHSRILLLEREIADLRAKMLQMAERIEMLEGLPDRFSVVEEAIAGLKKEVEDSVAK